MRIFTLALSSALLLPSALFGQTWESVNTGLTPDLTNLFFTSATNGYVLGSDATLHRTTDGGTSWTQLTVDVPPSISLNGLFVWPGVVGDIIYVSGNDNSINGANATLTKSINSGVSWTTQNINHTNGFENFITCRDADNCYLVGGQTNQGGMIAKTTSGGPDWTKSTMPGVAFFSQAAFPSENVGYAIGLDGGFAFGSIYRTDNGGQTWNLAGQVGSALFTIHCFSEAHLLVGDSGSDLWESTDFGVTWTQVNTPPITGLRTIDFVDASTGYIAAHDGMLKTTDGGVTWVNDSGFSGSDGLNAMQVLGHKGVAFAAGDAGKLYKVNFIPNDVPQLRTEVAVKVWPIPAQNTAEVSAASPLQRIVLTDLAGHIVSQSAPNDVQTSIDLHHLPNGLYFMQVETLSGIVQRKLVHTQ